MEKMMAEAAQAGDIDSLYELLENEPKLLDIINLKPFYDTPSHIAASAGHTLFVLETLLLKPSFGEKLNTNGLSPLHSALRNQRFETAKQVVKHHPELIWVKGRGGITPLHYVAVIGEVDLLAEFLMACPSSVEDLTCGESVVHVAVRDRCRGSFEVIFGWLIRFNTSKILQWKDREGNSALHIAAITNHSQVVSLLVKQIRVNDRNCEGLTALDLAIKFPGNESERIKKILK
ncbi:homeodomain transcription factor [Lithospermum erythrorhizon]|uniref:Homeodomain transcription factor n=1 Tax=Lithospermum erythrorhizon TaxID=34254 RepID=A0AAV3RE97_LITER